MGDPDIAEWLKAAESGAEQETEAAATVTFLDMPQTMERLREMAAVPGIKAVSLSSGGETRAAGIESAEQTPALKALASLEGDVASILADVGFGMLLDVSVQGGDTTWTTHAGPMAAVRLASDPRVREGLIAWHCKKLTGEASE